MKRQQLLQKEEKKTVGEPEKNHNNLPVLVPPVNIQAPVVLAAFRSPLRISCVGEGEVGVK